LGHGRGFIFSLLDGLEDVAGFGHPRPVNLLLRLAAFGLRGPGAVLAGTVKVLTHPLSFVLFQRAGVCFLFGHADVRQGIKDRPALHFQLAC
jgi:hypothetical protein